MCYLNAGSRFRGLVYRKSKGQPSVAQTSKSVTLVITQTAPSSEKSVSDVAKVLTQHLNSTLLLLLVYTPSRPHRQLCDHGDMQNVTFSFESRWGLGVPLFETNRTSRKQTCSYDRTGEYSSTGPKPLPDKTVNMAAKALSLSPSMTFPNWQTSIDMRIPPVARSRM